MSETPLRSIQERYQETISVIMVFRLRVITLLGGILHMSFTLFDRIVYPEQYGFLTVIRIISCFFIFFAHGATYIPWFRKRIRAVLVFIFTTAPVFTCIMIWGTNGVASRYYEGINLMALAMLIANGFDWRLNVGANLFILMVYTLCVLFSAASFDLLQYGFNMFFMGSTIGFVGLMTKFFGDQHYKAYSRNEVLNQNRKKLAQMFALVDEKARQDEVTKTYTQNYMLDLLARKVETFEKLKRNFYFVIVDLDDFKTIKDTYGHLFGNQVLQVVASVILENVSVGTAVGRYGGNEFMVLYESMESQEFSAQLGELCSMVNQTEVNGYDVAIKISANFCGVRFSPGRGQNVKHLLETADRTLLEIKHKGSDKIQIAGDDQPL